ncbi:MAG: LysM peptidoglycan-binding domain-containing protein [Candidatus Absconditabacterales bacterium]
MINFRRIHYVKFVSSLFLIVFFIFVIVYADKFSKGEEPIAIDSSFIQGDDGISNEINMDAITINVDSDNNGTIQYVVQEGDTLLKIASTFGTTVSNIQKTNDLKGEVQAGQTLKILNNDEGIVYVMKEKNNAIVFANKYNLNLQDLMTLNYLQDETEILNPGQEVFINISKEKSYEIGLLEKPKPEIISQTTVTYKPTINKPSQGSAKKTTTKKTSATTTYTTTDNDDSNTSVILSKWTYTKKIKNSFYPGYCTWYAAIISPNIFPYTDETNQERTFGGDANQWCSNAKEAGYRIGSKPSAGALIVYGRLRSAAGHVGKVISYDAAAGTMVVREMNYLGKFVVDERVEDASNSKIKCYIYGK